MIYLERFESLAQTTQQTEEVRLRCYRRVCSKHHIPSLPATGASLVDYLRVVDGRVGVDVLQQTVIAVRRWNIDRGYEDPLQSNLVKACYRAALKHCIVPETTAVNTHDLSVIVDQIPHTVVGTRDRAMLFLVYCARAGSAAISEINRADVRIHDRGMTVRIRHGRRTTQVPFKRHADARYCAVSAMERYLSHIDDVEEALFRLCPYGEGLTTRRMNASAIQASVYRWLPKTQRYRSLYAGCIVTGAYRDASDYDIMRQLGYRHIAPVRRWKARFIKDVSIVDKLKL